MIHQETIKTARSWDSFVPTLLEVLDIVKPKRCLEWGSGLSTKMTALYPSVESLETIEHDFKWLKRLEKQNPDNVTFYFKPKHGYAHAKLKHDSYDFIFVDGRRRYACLIRAMFLIEENGVVMLHDAERRWYHRAIKKFPYHIFTDNGSTCAMTHDRGVFKKMEKALCSM